MATFYQFSSNPIIANFNPLNDVLNVNTTSAASLMVLQVGTNVVIASNTSSAILQNMVLADLSDPTNVQFVDGSRLLVGDNQVADRAQDALGNTLTGTSGNDLLMGLGGNDSLSGGAGSDVLYGNEGNDTLNGGDGADRIYGNQGNDTIQSTGSAGNDTVFGGKGADTIEYSQTGSNLLIYGNLDGDAIATGSGRDTIYGGQGNDAIDGGGANNLLFGNLGDDTINGGSGNDTINGGDGADVIFAQNGTNQLFGGLGDDDIFSGADNDTISGGEGNDEIGAGAGSNLIYGNQGNDLIGGIFGSGARDTVYGGKGNDVITYFPSDDGVLAYGNVGDDTFRGSSRADTVFGGQGNDLIEGFAGADLLSGNEGADSFRIMRGFNRNDSGTTTATADIIRDFVTGQDKMLISPNATQVAGSATNYQEYVALGVLNAEAAFQSYANSAAFKTYTFIGGGFNGFLVIDADSNGVAEMIVVLEGKDLLSDFAFTDIV